MDLFPIFPKRHRNGQESMVDGGGFVESRVGTGFDRFVQWPSQAKRRQSVVPNAKPFAKGSPIPNRQP